MFRWNKRLRRCPNCGGKAKYRYKIPAHWVECTVCGYRTGYVVESDYFLGDARQESILDWEEGRAQRW